MLFSEANISMKLRTKKQFHGVLSIHFPFTTNSSMLFLAELDFAQRLTKIVSRVQTYVPSVLSSTRLDGFCLFVFQVFSSTGVLIIYANHPDGNFRHKYEMF